MLVVAGADELETGVLDLDDAIDDGAEEDRGVDEDVAGSDEDRIELLEDQMVDDKLLDATLEEIALLAITLDRADEATPLHKLPFSVGNSALPPFFST